VNKLIFTFFFVSVVLTQAHANVGSIVAWGSNYSECGFPSPNSGFVAIANAGGHSLGLKTNGSIAAWGFGWGFPLCDVPSPNSGFIAIETAFEHNLCLKANGSIVAWGNNDYGQCNIPSPNDGFVAIAAAYQHSLGLKADGSIVAWGSNSDGRCDIPSPNSDFIAIAARWYHSLGLKADGSIVVWGAYNYYGECDIPSPNSDFVAISAGGFHNLGLKADGSILAWGDNYYSQCNVPTPNSGFVAIAAGGFHSLGLKADGSIVAWGDNRYGECDIPLPNSGFVAIAAGYEQSLAILSECTTYYVNGTLGNDSWDGFAPIWNGTHGPKKTIQATIEACTDGDIVIVAPDIYYEKISFLGKAITVKSSGGYDTTIINGSQSGSVVTFDGGDIGYSVIEGFTITGGTGTGVVYGPSGGGIFCQDSSPTIKDCVIVNNSVGSGSGGGIACYNSSPTIIRCTISENTAHYGGGIYCVYYSTPLISNNVISQNGTGLYGAGIYCDFDSYPEIENSTITGNDGGIYCWGSGTATVTNCILWSNDDELYGCSATYSCIDDNDPGIGNIYIDPQLMSDGYHLWDTSPCIDAGDPNSGYAGQTDIDGDPRIINHLVDMGADEYMPPGGIILQSLEINQCFQEVEPDGITQKYKLIETKPFVVRINLKRIIPGTIPIKVKLDVLDSSQQTVLQPPPQNVEVTYGTPTMVDFVFNDNDTKNLIAGDYEFHVVVEDNGGNTLLDKSINQLFYESQTIRMIVVDRLYWNNELLGKWDPTYINFTEDVFPVPKTTAYGVNHIEIKPVVVFISGPSFDWPLGPYRLCQKLNNIMHSYNNCHQGGEAKFICAVVPEESLGQDRAGLKVGSAVLIEDNNYTKYVLGHEIGHIYGLGEEYFETAGKDIFGQWILQNPHFEFNRNPPGLKTSEFGPFRIYVTIIPLEYCDWDNDPNSYYHSEPIIDINDNLIGWESYGRLIGDGGYHADKQIDIQWDTISMMGGITTRTNPPIWISGRECNSLICELVSSHVESTKQNVSTAPESILADVNRVVISGILDIPEKSVELSPLISAANLEHSEEIVDANCELVFTSDSNAVLGRFGFRPLEGEQTDDILRGPFCVVVDLPSGTSAVQVIVDGLIADELQFTDNDPNVQIISPNGGEYFSGNIPVVWSASDPDTNDLSFSVEFSCDGGIEWSILSIHCPETELLVDTNHLPGGDSCLIKVISSDGWNCSEDVSDAPFSIETKPPKVAILEPTCGISVLPSHRLVGRCIAYDPETGDIIDPNAIEWSSSLNEFIGRGNLIGYNLSVGEHVITVTVTDPEGKTSTDTTNVRVVLNRSDFNYDGIVNFSDLAVFANRWLQACSEPNWCEHTDFDYSYIVDSTDLSIFTENWLWQKKPADFEPDGDVDLVDFAFFAKCWLDTNCAASNKWCNGTDLDNNTIVDLSDLATFVEYWLEGTKP